MSGTSPAPGHGDGDADEPEDDAGRLWLSLWDVWAGLWRNRLARWLTTPRMKEWRVARAVRAWERDMREQGRGETNETGAIGRSVLGILRVLKTTYRHSVE